MLLFTSVKVSSFELDQLVTTWTVELNPPYEDVTKFHFYVQRSNSPEGPFDELNTTPLIDIYTYTDSQIDRLSKWRRFFYRIKAINIDTNEEIISQNGEFSVPTLTVQKRVQLEIIRTEKILLQGVGVTPGFVGVKCLLLIRRTFGQRCSECWDILKKKVRVSQCDFCYSTGFDRGYHTPIVSYINFSPPADQIEIEPIGESQPNIIRAWTTNYPPLTGGDLVIDGANLRWRVVSQTRTEILRNLTRQNLTLYHLPPGDIEYRVLIDSTLLE